jgi:hypothetical protein
LRPINPHDKAMNFFNLLAPYKSEITATFQKPACHYLVTQTFMRGHCPEFPEKKPILLTPYATSDLARNHLAQICIDKYKAIIDLTNPKHGAKMQTMDTPTSPYLLYIAIVNHPTAINIKDHEGFAECILKFLSARLKRRIESPDAISASMELRYGEFYTTLALNGETISERLCVIEHANLKESASTFPPQLILKC